MALFAVYYYTEETFRGERVSTRELVTTSLFTAQMVVAELTAEGKEAWIEAI